MKWRITLLTLIIPTTCFAGFDNYLCGSRSAGLSHASVTLSDPWSVSNNQAGLAWLKKMEAAAYYENRYLLREFGIASASLVMPLKNGGIGLSFRQYGYALYSENKTGLAYALRLNEKISAGIQINYQTLNIGDVYGSRSIVTGEIGLQARISGPLHFGVHLYNPVRTKISEDGREYVPSVFRAGLSYHFSKILFIASEVQKDIDRPVIFRTGIEYLPHPSVVMSIGCQNNPFRYSVGSGFTLENIALDLSVNYHSLLGISSQAGLCYKFNKK